jgi:hypothetical protein
MRRADFSIVYDQPDEELAIKHAIEEFEVPENQRNRLIARRRDWADHLIMERIVESCILRNVYMSPSVPNEPSRQIPPERGWLRRNRAAADRPAF